MALTKIFLNNRLFVTCYLLRAGDGREMRGPKLKFGEEDEAPPTEPSGKLWN
jgi:hypothetical protein